MMERSLDVRFSKERQSNQNSIDPPREARPRFARKEKKKENARRDSIDCVYNRQDKWEYTCGRTLKGSAPKTVCDVILFIISRLKDAAKFLSRETGRG